MKARVRSDARWAKVTAFGGAEFVKTEWRDVPERGEAAAASHPDLIIQDGPKETAKAPNIEKEVKPAAEDKKASPKSAEVPEVTDETSGTDLQRGSGRGQRGSDS